MNDPATAVAFVGVMQVLAMGCVMLVYRLRDKYAADDAGPCDHELAAIGVQSPVSLGAAFTAARTTVILYRCRYCAHVESVTVDGAWTLAQVRAWGHQIMPGDWDPSDDATVEIGDPA